MHWLSLHSFGTRKSRGRSNGARTAWIGAKDSSCAVDGFKNRCVVKRNRGAMASTDQRSSCKANGVLSDARNVGRVAAVQVPAKGGCERIALASCYLIVMYRSHPGGNLATPTTVVLTDSTRRMS